MNLIWLFYFHWQYKKIRNSILWGPKFFFPCSPNSAPLYQRIQIPSSSHSSKLTYIMCLERRFFSRGSGALRHAGQDSTDQWPSAAHRPPPWHHTFHNTDPKDAHTTRIWSFNLCLFVQRKLVFLLLFSSFLGFVLLCFWRAVLLCNLTFWNWENQVDHLRWNISLTSTH